MLIEILKSKLHRVEVTDAALHYEGSLGVDTALLDAAGMMAYEKVLVGNITNGQRFETYLIPAEHGSGAIVLNGAVARLGAVGDLLVVMAFAQLTPEEALTHRPRTVHATERNRVITKVV